MKGGEERWRLGEEVSEVGGAQGVAVAGCVEEAWPVEVSGSVTGCKKV